MLIEPVRGADAHRHRRLVMHLCRIVPDSNGGVGRGNKAVFVRNQLDDFLFPIFIPENIVQIQLVLRIAAVIAGRFGTSHIDSTSNDEIDTGVGDVQLILSVLAKILAKRGLQKENHKKNRQKETSFHLNELGCKGTILVYKVANLYGS